MRTIPICISSFCLFVLSLKVSLSICYLPPTKSNKSNPPNIIFILTDDQDDVLGSTDVMPHLEKLIMKRGVRLVNNFVTSPICCPSRAAIVTGRYAHNNLAINNSLSGNCSSTSWQKREEPRALPKLLHDAGYQTFFAGKYLNDYGRKSNGGFEYVPPGWDWWAAWIQKTHSNYYNYHMSVNGTLEKHGSRPEDYLTSVIEQKATEFLKFTSTRQPFFMWICPTAPHDPFTPLPKYNQNFTDLVAPRTPSFNFNSEDKHWLVKVKPEHLPEEVTGKIDEIYRNRLRTLQSVDSMIKHLVHKLEAIGQLENTVIIFSSDNGFHLGQFCLPWGKRMNYEFDIKTPLAITGPGIMKGKTRTEPVQTIDITTTILDLAGLSSAPDWQDGRSFLPLVTQDRGQARGWRKFALVEYRGEAVDKVWKGCPYSKHSGLAACWLPLCMCMDARNNTYSCLRHLTPEFNEVYCEFNDDVGFREYYDLSRDPWQLTNQLGVLPAHRLDKLHTQLAAMKSCNGESCRLFDNNWIADIDAARNLR